MKRKQRICTALYALRAADSPETASPVYGEVYLYIHLTLDKSRGGGGVPPQSGPHLTLAWIIFMSKPRRPIWENWWNLVEDDWGRLQKRSYMVRTNDTNVFASSRAFKRCKDHQKRPHPSKLMSILWYRPFLNDCWGRLKIQGGRPQKSIDHQCKMSYIGGQSRNPLSTGEGSTVAVTFIFPFCSF